MIWTRVTRHNPCPICGKPDWCVFNEVWIYCMRVESRREGSSGGWLHPVNDRQEATNLCRSFTGCVMKRENDRISTLVIESWLGRWKAHQNGELEPFAATLGVSQASLRALGCVWAWEHRAYAFPMRDANGRVIGIRLRNERGDKWAVKGSRQGLFISTEKGGDASCPSTIPNSDKRTMGSNAARTVQAPSAATLLIVEGPTDTAAAIDLGYDVVGRPSCLGQEDMIVRATKSAITGCIFIIADADARQCRVCKGKGCNGCGGTGILEPGRRGAIRLQAKLRKAKIITLPAKDLRSAVQLGMTRTIFEQILNAAL